MRKTCGERNWWNLFKHLVIVILIIRTILFGAALVTFVVSYFTGKVVVNELGAEALQTIIANTLKEELAKLAIECQVTEGVQKCLIKIS